MTTSQLVESPRDAAVRIPVVLAAGLFMWRYQRSAPAAHAGERRQDVTERIGDHEGAPHLDRRWAVAVQDAQSGTGRRAGRTDRLARVSVITAGPIDDLLDRAIRGQSRRRAHTVGGAEPRLAPADYSPGPRSRAAEHVRD